MLLATEKKGSIYKVFYIFLYVTQKYLIQMTVVPKIYFDVYEYVLQYLNYCGLIPLNYFKTTALILEIVTKWFKQYSNFLHVNNDMYKVIREEQS